MRFLKGEVLKKYMLNQFEKRKGEDLGKRLPFADEDCIVLLKRMLEFSPEKRITASEALKMEIFDDVRIPENEEA